MPIEKETPAQSWKDAAIADYRESEAKQEADEAERKARQLLEVATELARLGGAMGVPIAERRVMRDPDAPQATRLEAGGVTFRLFRGRNAYGRHSDQLSVVTPHEACGREVYYPILSATPYGLGQALRHIEAADAWHECGQLEGDKNYVAPTPTRFDKVPYAGAVSATEAGFLLALRAVVSEMHERFEAREG